MNAIQVIGVVFFGVWFGILLGLSYIASRIIRFELSEDRFSESDRFWILATLASATGVLFVTWVAVLVEAEAVTYGILATIAGVFFYFRVICFCHYWIRYL